MDRLQEKTTAPYPPVGADGGQSLSQKPNQSIAEGVTEHKPPERDLEEILRQISRVNDPAQTVDKPKSTVIFHKEKRISMSNI